MNAAADFPSVPSAAGDETRLVVFGLGYSGRAIAALARESGFAVTVTSRTPGQQTPPADVAVIGFDDAERAIGQATHLVSTAAPGEEGDPVLLRFGAAIAVATSVRWIGYLSTTGVYGDRQGGWVSEATPAAPGSPRSKRRVAAEQAWARLAERCAVDLFRLAGIYGPGRSMLDDLREGTARRVIAPGHAFGRIHRDDIAQAVVAAARQPRGPGLRVLNLVDDEPAESAHVVEEAAALLGIEPPPAVPLEEAVQRMSPMARSFWAENRKIANTATKAALGIAWRYPTFREGLRGILAEERNQGPT